MNDEHLDDLLEQLWAIVESGFPATHPRVMTCAADTIQALRQELEQTKAQRDAYADALGVQGDQP